jgi:uncharacterized protein (DUF2252 family)
MVGQSAVRQVQVVEHLRLVHAGRDPAGLALKYCSMRASFAAFARGTCSLHYTRMRDNGSANLPASPSLPICGDAHLANFGVYEGDDARLRFDLGDFDESTTASCLHDVVRLLCALHTTLYGIDADDPRGGPAMANEALAAYADALAASDDAAFGDDAAPGEHASCGELVTQLFVLARQRARDRNRWLDERTLRTSHGIGSRRFRLDGDTMRARTRAERLALFGVANGIAKALGEWHGLHAIDAVRWIVGPTGVGLPRFLVAAGADSASVRLLDMKAARAPALAAAGVAMEGAPAPGAGTAPDDARRIVAAQQRILEHAAAPLVAVELFGKPFTVRELQPAAIRFVPSEAYPPRFGALLGTVLARAHLRTARREGLADAMREFAADSHAWQAPVALLARTLAAECRDDWLAFRQACSAGDFAAQTGVDAAS